MRQTYIATVKNNSIDLDQLRIFLTVVDQKTVTNAAIKLGLSSSGVSQAIKALEKDLGRDLFVRDTRPLRLTETGRLLDHEGRHLLKEADSMRARICSEDQKFRDLRLGIGESAMGTFGPWLLAELQTKFSDITAHTEMTYPLANKVISDEIDVALCAEPLYGDERIERRQAYREDFLLVTSKKFAPITTLADLRRLTYTRPFIGYGKDCADKHPITQLLQGMDIPLTREISVSSSFAIIGLLTLTGGWTIMTPTNLWCGKPFIDQLNITPMPTEHYMTRTMWVIGNAAQTAKIELVAKCVGNVMHKLAEKELDLVLPGLSNHITISN